MSVPFSLTNQVTQQEILTFTVTSGKGGVGKSTLSLNLAIALAQRKYRVILMDGDLGLGNINVMLGVQPKKDLSDVIDGVCEIQDTIIRGPWGIAILPAGTGYADLANIDEISLGRLISALQNLSHYADILVIDTGAGIGTSVLNLALAADKIIVILTPDISSLTDAYSLIKVISQRPGTGRFEVVINRALSIKDGEKVIEKLQFVTKKFLGRDIKRLGFIHEDRNIQNALLKRKPLLFEAPRCTSAMEIRTIADSLVLDIRQRKKELPHYLNFEDRFKSIIENMRKSYD